MAKLRIFQIATELKVPHTEILSFLKSKGIQVGSHFAPVDEETYHMILKEFHKDQQQTLFNELEIGSILKGRVKNITDFGVFVNLGDSDGLLHISEISWTNKKPYISEIYSIGDIIDVKVISIDNKNRKISLSVKQLQPDPWKNINEIYSVGENVVGKVVSKVEPGLIYIELNDNLLASLHVTDLDWIYPLAELRFEKIELEEEIEVQVVEVNYGYRQLSVGIKQMTDNPINKEEWQSLKIGDSIQCEVYKVLENYSIMKISEKLYGRLLLIRAEVPVLGEKVDVIVASKDQNNGLITVSSPENSIAIYDDRKKEKTYQTAKTSFRPSDTSLLSLDNLKKSTLWDFIDEAEREYIEKSFVRNPDLFNKVFKGDKVLQICFEPLDQRSIWGSQFINNVAPALGGDKWEGSDKNIREALLNLSNQKYWYNQYHTKDDKQIFQLVNEDISIRGDITGERKFYISSIKIKGHSYEKKNTSKFSPFSLDCPIEVHHIYDSVVEDTSSNDIVELLEEKIESFNILKGAKQKGQDELLVKGNNFNIFKEYLEAEMEYEKLFVNEDEIIVESCKSLPIAQEIGKTIECSSNSDFPFKEYQYISIHLSANDRKPAATAQVDQINGKKMIIVIKEDILIDDLRNGFTARKVLSLRQYQDQIGIINTFLNRETQKEHKLYDALHKPDSLPPSELPEIKFKNKFLEKGLNGQNNQPIAVRKSVGNKNILLIQGPPGTGKTTVITEIVQQLVERGERVLVTGQTHVSVDNVLDKVKELPKELLRVGRETQSGIDEKAYNFLSHRQLEEFKTKIIKLVQIKQSIKPLLEDLSYDEILNEQYIKDVLKPHCIKQIEEQKFSERLEKLFHKEINDYLVGIFGKEIEVVNEIIDLIKDWEAQVAVLKKLWLPMFYKSRDVVFGTCIGMVMDEEFMTFNADKRFDTVIVDEAGKANLSETLAAISIADKIILVGDHKQLPPYMDRERIKYFIGSKENSFSEEKVTKAISTSLFEYLQEILPESHKVLLNIQHRMHPNISRFVSETFYDGRIKDGPNTKEKALRLNPPYDKEVIFFDTSKDMYPFESEAGTSYCNKLESQIIVKEVLPVLKEDNRVESKDIAIVVPYLAQLELIISELSKKNLDDIEVATLDSYQGREVRIMIFSFTRSSKNNNVGFLDDARRLNVAFSRPETKLILVGNSETLTCPRNHSDSYYTKLFERLVLHAKGKEHGTFISGIKKSDQLRQNQQQMKKYDIGSIHKGKVKELKNFGAVIEIANGITGFIHISELSRLEPKHPSQVVLANDQVMCKVIENKKKGGISLSLKHLNPGDIFSRSEQVTGIIIKRIAPGILVRLHSGFVGLIYDPQVRLTGNKFANKKRILVEIKDINNKKRKIDLRWVPE